MTLTSTTFIIKPNQYDGRQRLSDPAGTYQPPTSSLQPVTELQITNPTTSSQTLSWAHDEGDGIEGYVIEIWIAQQDTAWRSLDSVAVGTKTYTATSLPSGRYVRYRVAAAIETPYQISAWAEVDGNTLSQGGGGETNLLALTYFYNFEHLSHGERVDANSEFTTCKNFTCDTGRAAVAGGTRCGHTFLQGNNSTTGYGDWGYALNGLPNVLHGGEAWWRKAIFWPTNGYYGSSGALLKQMRFRRHTLGNGNRGSTEVGLDGNKRLKLSVEFVDSTHDDGYGGLTTNYVFNNAVIPFGRWVWFETYVKFHEDKTIGEVAVWVDGVPSGRVFGPTAMDTGEKHDEYFMATYWNGYEDRSDYNEQWYDQIAIAQEGPIEGGTANDKQYLATDSDGYKFIGTATNTSILR